MTSRYKVEEIITQKADGHEATCFFILDRDIPDFIINNWLELKGINSPLTARQYAYNLVRFLNYLHSVGKEYKSANKMDVINYMQALLHGSSEENIVNFKANVTVSTGVAYLNTIKEFYRYLEDYLNGDLTIRISKGDRRSAKNSYLYGQIWDMESKELLLTRVVQHKEKKRYIRWYTDEQIQAILTNLRTVRDRAIFRMSLEGMRIDEILSLNVYNYVPEKSIINTNRSKGNKKRVVVLREETVKELENYLFTERALVEERVGLKDALFLNNKEGKHLGEPVKYDNILKILKRAAACGGLDPATIRTHSGRSTRTMELLHHQAEHPEDNLSDAQIRMIMGWSSERSMEPYVNYTDERMLVASAKKTVKKNDSNSS